MRKYLALMTLWISACSNAPTLSPDSPVASQAKPISENRTTCTQNNDTRFLEIKPRENGSCDLLYTKFGSEKAVASGGTQYCKSVGDKIITHLTRSGFSCE